VGRRVIEARVHGRKASSHSWLCPTVHSEVFPCFVPEERKLKLCRLIRFILGSRSFAKRSSRAARSVSSPTLRMIVGNKRDAQSYRGCELDLT